MPHRDDETRLSRVRRLIRNGIAAAGLATTMTLASPAAAEPLVYGDVGVHLGYTWGEGGGFTWGLEGRVVRESDEWGGCNDGIVGVVAGVARLSFVGMDPWLSGAVQGGVITPTVPITLLGELGLGYRFGELGGLSVPVGMEMAVYMVDSFVRFDTTLGGGTVGGGARGPWPERQFGCVVAGRALHAEEGRAELPRLRAIGDRERRSALGEELSSAVAGEWGRRAQGEWASVPAFLQLADQLVRARAPRGLVVRALRAADDELRHAEQSGRIAVEHRGAPLALGRVTPATRAPAVGLEALRRLAVESWVDGCLGEGRAAETAAREGSRATDRRARDVQHGIASDEASHADLAWDVLAWTVREGGDDVRHAVWAARDAEPDHGSGGPSAIDLRAYGILDDASHRSIADETRARAEPRLSRLLG